RRSSRRDSTRAVAPHDVQVDAPGMDRPWQRGGLPSDRRPADEPSQILASSPKYSWSSWWPPSPSPKALWLSQHLISRIHLTILKPSWFSTGSRRGGPYSVWSGSPFIS